MVARVGTNGRARARHARRRRRRLSHCVVRGCDLRSDVGADLRGCDLSHDGDADRPTRGTLRRSTMYDSTPEPANPIFIWLLRWQARFVKE